MTTTDSDNNLQTNIKSENKGHVDNQLKSSTNIDQPLLIVLDEDDVNIDEENELTRTKKSNESLSKVKQTITKSKTSLTNKQTHRRKKTHLVVAVNSRHQQSTNHSNNNNKYLRTVVIDTNFMQEQTQTATPTNNRSKTVSRRKLALTSENMSTNNSNTKAFSIDENTSNSTTDPILSKISFDNHSDILTVSRMGSIFYCLEDLYMKVFMSLCTLEELGNLLLKIDSIRIKQATLSEKMSIDQHSPVLKKYNENRYRLISINSSEYLLKLKQLLLTLSQLDQNEKQQREQSIDQIVDEMRSYKRTPTVVLLKDKVSHSPMSTKRLSSDDEEDDDDEESEGHLKILTKKQKSNETPPTQFGIFIQCNGPVSCNIFSTNETVSSTTTTKTTTTTTTTNNNNNTDTTTTAGKNDTENQSKKSNEHTQVYFDKIPEQYPNFMKFNIPDEQTSILTRTDSESPTDCCQINKLSSSNMPIKRRILCSYTSDTNDSSSTITAMHMSLNNQMRSLYRSKSLSFLCQPNVKTFLRRRSSSLPIINIHLKEYSSNVIKEQNTTMNMKSKTEPIDVIDGSFSMPMIVNVEENVDLNNHRQKLKTNQSKINHSSDSETRLSSTRTSPPSVLTKPSLVYYGPSQQHSSSSISSSSSSSSMYRQSVHPTYHQDSHTYRDSAQNLPSSYHHPTNGNHYTYPHSSSGHYPIVKKSKDSPMPSPHDTRSHSSTPNHSTAMMNNTNHHQYSSSLVMPIVRKPNYYYQLTPEQQASVKMQTSSPPSTVPCRLSCCYPSPTLQPHPPSTPHQQQQQQQQQQHLSDKLTNNERTIYRQYSTSTSVPQTFKRDPSRTPELPNSSPAISRKQRRMDLVPLPPQSPANLSISSYPGYPSSKSYFIPPPLPSSSSSSVAASHWSTPSSSPSNPNIKSTVRYPYLPPPPPSPHNGMTRKMEPYSQPRRPIPVPSRAPLPPQPPPSSTPVVVQNSSTLISPPNTPHELPLPNNRIRSIDLQRAIIERGYCDMDKLPKLVVRHTKTYSNRTIDTMGQLFPTWFNEPDYRCIHCFRCDQVFTPQQFMTHVDDDLSQIEQPISMTSIQLLTSEKMSEYKVGLWNQFCTNLTIYAREGRIGGFSTNRAV